MYNSNLRPPVVLIAEDDEHLCNLLHNSLKRAGYEVLYAYNGQDALELFISNRVDIVLLDYILPRLDGSEVCAAIRKISDVPIVVLTALNRVDNIVHVLELGVDEYITKPFAFKELEARLEGMLRRVNWTQMEHTPSIITTQDVILNSETEEVTVRGKLTHLTGTEYKLLYALISRADQIVSRETLLEEIWGSNTGKKSSLVESNIRRLRKRIEAEPSNPKYLVTVPGQGYMFQASQSRLPVENLEAAIPELPLPAKNIKSNITLNTLSKRVMVRGKSIRLTNIEYELLHYLIQNSRKILSKVQILQDVWGRTSTDSSGAISNDTAVVATSIQRLRIKIEEDPSQPIYLVTVRGQGYQFFPDGDSQ